MQLHDDEGARQFRTYAIQFDPGSQRLDVRLARIHRADGSVLEATEAFEQQLGEPWYRIYYDTRARVLVFPDLEPGDTVELRWRIDDVWWRETSAVSAYSIAYTLTVEGPAGRAFEIRDVDGALILPEQVVKDMATQGRKVAA